MHIVANEATGWAGAEETITVNREMLQASKRVVSFRNIIPVNCDWDAVWINYVREATVVE